MAGDTRDEDARQSRQTEEAALSARLRQLSERLERSQTSRPPEPVSSTYVDGSALGRGLRLSTEFVVGVLLGAIIGWAFDHWLKTSPLGLIAFTLLGFAAAVTNLVRSTRPGPGTAVNSGTQRQQD